MALSRVSHRPLSVLCAGGSLLLLSACSKHATPAAEVADLAETPYQNHEEDLPALEGESGPIAKKESPRRVGDLWVHRFSGTYRTEALLLKEEVIGREGDLLVVDYTLTEGESENRLRVRMAKRSERIITVARIIDGEEVPGTMSDFDALMEKTSFVPDRNHGKVAEKSQTCLVGKNELNCELSQFKVLLGDEEATLTVAHNDELRRDISGEITAVDGTILYHAELVEMQRGQASARSEEGIALVDENIDLNSRD